MYIGFFLTKEMIWTNNQINTFDYTVNITDIKKLLEFEIETEYKSKIMQLNDPRFMLQYPFDYENEKLKNYLMPAPSKIEFGKYNQVLTLNPNIGIAISFKLKKFSTITNALERFYDKLDKLTRRTITRKAKTGAPTLSISCKEEIKIPFYGMNESYTLEIKSNSIELESATSIGIIRGLETLCQLLITKHKSIKFFFPLVSIQDSPRFGWRGLLIDVARRFLTVEQLKIQIEAMSILKLNVLHLHLSDDQGFRLEIRSRPKLHEIGGRGQYYRKKDFEKL